MQKTTIFLLILFSVISYAQETEGTPSAFDFKTATADVQIIPETAMVSGTIAYEFEVLYAVDTLKIDGKNMQFSKVKVNDQPVASLTTSEGLILISDFKKSKNNLLELHYEVKPTKGMYFINWEYPEAAEADKQVWTQGQGNFTSTWLPSFDELTEKMVFHLNISFPSSYTVIANGVLKSSEKINDSITRWNFYMEKPMSSYLLGFAAGKFANQQIFSSTGDTLSLYYRPVDSSKVEATYRHSKQIFDFLENEIGVPYPWQNYKQIPVLDFLYAGMENTGTTIFTQDLVTDSIGYNDRNYVMVNAHELAHQWFGNYVTAKNGKHHWLHEGFSTYYALLAEREIFGDDYYYWTLYESAERLKELSDSGQGKALLDDKAGSLTYYQKGAWALHILREKVGTTAFNQAVKNYLEKFAFQNVDSQDFIAEVEKTFGQDLDEFVKNWLEQSAFKANAALQSLKQSEFMTSYLEIAALRETPLEQKFEMLSTALDFPVNDYIGQEVVNQLSGNSTPQAHQLYRKAFESNNLYVRQAIALNMEVIPSSLVSQYESLLYDDSYLTQEKALFTLWEQFPGKRKKYLNQMRDVEGFFNKNVRMLWLTLSLVTQDFEPERSSEYFKELSGYAAEEKPFQVRQNAFSYLFQLGAFNSESLKSLVKGTTHHTYQFRNYCRELLSALIQNEKYRAELLKISEDIPEEDSTYLMSKLEY